MLIAHPARTAPTAEPATLALFPEKALVQVISIGKLWSRETSTGVIFSNDGRVLADLNAVYPSDRLYFQYGEKIFSARLQGQDSLTGLAVLSTDFHPADRIDIASHGEVRNGEPLFLVGRLPSGEILSVPARMEGPRFQSRTSSDGSDIVSILTIEKHYRQFFRVRFGEREVPDEISQLVWTKRVTPLTFLRGALIVTANGSPVGMVHLCLGGPGEDGYELGGSFVPFETSLAVVEYLKHVSM